ncbi:hypothetical protein MMC26_004633 [Xylographa opegraphella]|nr:hypothetical protein [Xylographa opegraphella]
MAMPLPSTGIRPGFALDTDKSEQKRIWHRFSRWMGKTEQPPCTDTKQESEPGRPSLGRRLSRKVVPGLPRPATFRRQNSERRERLTPVEPSGSDRRPASHERRRAMSARPPSPLPISIPKLSAPAVCKVESPDFAQFPRDSQNNGSSQTPEQPRIQRPAPPPSPPPDLPQDLPTPMSEPSFNDDIDEQIKAELEEKWILNLSMHFRDKSPREKFFVTYAETPTRWRRVTVSCDYRDAPPESLERDLQGLQYQRDKSARIYEAIRMSLPEIQFYDTVTNLKLETSQDDRLHVHVTEDTNEIIPYPSTHAVQHLRFARIPESEVMFESHMSGFVYKVRVHGHICIKKEIPGPDSVEEFLYEINALSALRGAQNVIQFQGLVVDERHDLVKGLLISFAEQGPLVDMIFDYKGSLEWARRERWAKQIVRGLSEIHEAGFVQGDFTLSNIVIDDHDRAHIIDINRRGCPVGWEPPEIARLIESSQRISIYIGVKSDLFQLGMVLWALAEEEDEPERQPRELYLKDKGDGIPQYYRDLTNRCLSDHPQDRLSARKLLSLFPPLNSDYPTPRPSLQNMTYARPHSSSAPSQTQYIDPSQAVEREDIDLGHEGRSRPLSSDSHTHVARHSSLDIPFDGPGTYIVNSRGHEPFTGTECFDFPNRGRHWRPADSQSEGDEAQIVPVSPSGENRWEEIVVDGRGYLVHKNSIDLNDEDDGDDVRSRRGRSMQRLSEILGPERTRGMEHVDSGLADMDLVGVGGNEMLREPGPQEREEVDMDLQGQKDVLGDDPDAVPENRQTPQNHERDLRQHTETEPVSTT